jgi:Helicase associated domain
MDDNVIAALKDVTNKPWDFKLGVWVAIQRRMHAEGSLNVDRQRRLQDLTGWTWDPVDQGEEGFSRPLDYVERHGDARVPQSYMVDGYPLGTWVQAQRDNHTRGTLEVDRQRRLQDLTGGTPRRPWDEGFSRLLDYVKCNGDARVSQSYTVDGYQLGARGSRSSGVSSPRVCLRPIANADSRT